MSGALCAARLIKPPYPCQKPFRSKTIFKWLCTSHVYRITCFRHLLSSRCTAAARWKDELYCRSFVFVLCSPQGPSMCLDDRSTNRKPQPHPSRFGSKKRFEDSFRVLYLKPMTSVTHRNHNRSGSISSGGNLQLAGVLAAHCISGIQNQIQNYLLQLNPISQDWGQMSC